MSGDGRLIWTILKIRQALLNGRSPHLQRKHAPSLNYLRQKWSNGFAPMQSRPDGTGTNLAVRTFAGISVPWQRIWPPAMKGGMASCATSPAGVNASLM